MSPLYSLYNTLRILWVGSRTLWSHECLNWFPKVHEAVLSGIPWWFYCTVHWFKKQSYWEPVTSPPKTAGTPCQKNASSLNKKFTISVVLVAAGGYRLGLNNIQSVTELVKQKTRTLGIDNFIKYDINYNIKYDINYNITLL